MRVRRHVAALVAPAAGGLLVLVQAVFVAARRPVGAVEARLVDAASAVLHPGGPAVAPVGLDGLAARLQLTAYALATGAFERRETAVAGGRELGLVTCAAVLVAVVALARGLGVRPSAAGLVLVALALTPPAVAALVTITPGLLGAAWLAVGAALLAGRHRVTRAIGIPAVVAAVASAPVLAVPVLVVGATLLVAERLRRGALVLGLTVAMTVLALVLLPPPAGPAAVPALVVTAVLVGFVLADEARDRIGRLGHPLRRAQPDGAGGRGPRRRARARPASTG